MFKPSSIRCWRAVTRLVHTFCVQAQCLVRSDLCSARDTCCLRLRRAFLSDGMCDWLCVWHGQGTGVADSERRPFLQRKLADALQSLDEAVGSISDSSAQPPPAKRPRVARSIYSTLAKYGIRTKTDAPSSSIKRTESLSKAPHLSAILSRAATRTRKALPFRFSSDDASLSASPSFGDYRPSSTQSFMLRLGTYKLPTYSNKPSAIDAVAAAKCGWINDGKERLVCGLCNASWVLAGREGLSRDAANALVEKQRIGLVQNHKDGCPWKTRQSDDGVYRIPLRSPAAMARDLKARAIQLDPLLQGVQIKHPVTSTQVQALVSTIRSVSAKPPSWDLDLEKDGSTEQRSPEHPAEPEPEPSETAVLASLFGWDIAPPPPTPTRRTSSYSCSRSSSIAPSRPGTPSPCHPPSISVLWRNERAQTPSISLPKRLGSHLQGAPSSTRSASVGSKREATVLYCPMCQRRVGLWAFAPPSDGAASPGASTPSASSVPRHTRPQRQFDLLLEHRNYCPYVVKSTVVPSLSSQPQNLIMNFGSMSQSQSSGAVEGWRAVLQVISRYGLAERRRRKSTRQLGVTGNENGASTEEAEGHVQDESDMIVDSVEAMVADVKTRGGKDILKYVKGLLG
ncbi:zf-C3HC-domain-containing protein [Gloeophyllum trabeum ATCC 11539]|uniref:Zf-C3HC-domain-containing protein n=1 Tax=Gloeophyllum trabeum (strain ATCC 11539 / FP-39264 / Madison 617) TaxID=670483 RepID=S7RNK9_GLOTA|nr:zf-C3HC-domain-containing protein [Gloeophyllum trabeum ATCC 11539]EPQ54354.1 zf-C3HC-domain-containing protein [Gloeophyllum trabeum ATCC 11539]